MNVSRSLVRRRTLGACLGMGAALALVAPPASSVTAATAADPPTNVSASSGAMQSTITWTPPANNGGSAVTYYAIFAYPQLATNPVQLTASTTYTMTGLTPNTLYVFTVTDWNGVGWSAWSGWSPWVRIGPFPTTPPPTPNPNPGGTKYHPYVTLYGYVDNSPPGTAIAYPRIHSGASGTGTWADPETFATDAGEFKPGTIFYYPYVQKYFIMEDGCTECTKDWTNCCQGDNPTPLINGRKYRVDLWAGGDANSIHDPEKTALLNCEDNLTQPSGGDIFVNPPSNLVVDPTPIFNSKTLACEKPH